MLDLDERVDVAVDNYLKADDNRLRATRLLTLAFAGLFAAAALGCLIAQEWGFTVVYALIATGIVLFTRRFLPRGRRSGPASRRTSAGR